MYAILPAAGFGTRFLPWSKAVPKELLPVGDHPVIHGVVAEAAAVGIRDVVLVLSKGKEAILNYFEADPELEGHLAKTGKSGLLDEWRALVEGLRFHVVYQPEMKGLGDAILCGWKSIPDDTPAAVLLPDTLVRGTSPLPAMVHTLETTGRGSVAVEEVTEERAGRYGVCGGRETGPGVYDLNRMIEKPSPEEIPRMELLSGNACVMAFAARYVFPAGLRGYLERTRPGKNGEIQLTDAMAALLEADGFAAHRLEGFRQDIGNPDGLREALSS